MFSILYEKEKKQTNLKGMLFFLDLNIDTIIEQVSFKTTNQAVKEIYYEGLTNIEDALYRQGIFRDLLIEENFNTVNHYATLFMKYYNQFYNNLKCKYSIIRQIKLKQSINAYLDFVNEMKEAFNNLNFLSQGMKDFCVVLDEYVKSESFISLTEDSNILAKKMDNVRYLIGFENEKIKIFPYSKKKELAEMIMPSLESFADGKRGFSNAPGIISELIQSQIYDELSKHYKSEFLDLKEYFVKHRDFYNEDIIGFSKDIEFYLSYILFIKDIEKQELSFCIPLLSKDKNLLSKQGFDLALASNYHYTKKKMVLNDIILDKEEEVMIISGPNQGGKTTFSRYFGQSLYLASLGLPVPGIEAKMPFIHKIYSLFLEEENSNNLNGKLQTELLRIKEITDCLEENDVLIMNEVFSSTSYQDGILLGKKVIDIMNKKHVLAVFVTFLDELADYNKHVVSLKSLVDKDNPEIRLFKIVRSSEEEMGYAMAIAKKNEMTYHDIVRRLKNER